MKKATGAPFWWNMNSICCATYWVYKPTLSVFVHQRANNCPSMTKISMGQGTHYLSVYQIWGLYITFKAMNADNWLWPIFGCKVGQCPDWNETNSKLTCDTTYYMFIPSFKLISQNMYKKVRETFRWLGALLTPPFKCFGPPEGQKLPIHDKNQ